MSARRHQSGACREDICETLQSLGTAMAGEVANALGGDHRGTADERRRYTQITKMLEYLKARGIVRVVDKTGTANVYELTGAPWGDGRYRKRIEPKPTTPRMQVAPSSIGRTCLICGFRDAIGMTDWEDLDDGGHVLSVREVPACAPCVTEPDVDDDYIGRPSVSEEILDLVGRVGVVSSGEIAARLGSERFRDHRYMSVTKGVSRLARGGYLTIDRWEQRTAFYKLGRRAS